MACVLKLRAHMDPLSGCAGGHGGGAPDLAHRRYRVAFHGSGSLGLGWSIDPVDGGENSYSPGHFLFVLVYAQGNGRHS